MSNDEVKRIVEAVLDVYRGEPTPDFIVDRILEDAEFQKVLEQKNKEIDNA